MESEVLVDPGNISGDDESFFEEKIRRPYFKCPITVEIIAFGVFLADSLSGSVTTNFIVMKTCEFHFHPNKSVCAMLDDPGENTTDIESLVQPYSSVILTGMNFLTILFPAFTTLFLGPWSDCNGRKPVLIISALGFLLKYVLLGALSFIPDLDPKFGLVAVIPVALTGGIITFLTVAYLYINDITQDANRTFRITILESFVYMGCTIGLLCTSFIFKVSATNGYAFTYGSCAFIIIVSTAITYFFVPETIQSTEGNIGLCQVFELKVVKEILRVCFKRRAGCRRAVIFLVIVSWITSVAAEAGESNILFLFTRLRFGWNIRDFTLWTSVMLALNFIVIVSWITSVAAEAGESNILFLFTRLRFGWNIRDFTLWTSVMLALNFIGLFLWSLLLSKWLKLSDPILALISYTMKTFGSLFIAFVPSNAPNMLYYSGFVKLFDGVCGPASRAILSKTVPKEDLGKLFAFAGSSASLFPLAIVPFYTLVYNLTLNTLPSAFLFISAILFIISAVIFIIIYFVGEKESEDR